MQGGGSSSLLLPILIGVVGAGATVATGGAAAPGVIAAEAALAGVGAASATYGGVQAYQAGQAASQQADISALGEKADAAQRAAAIRRTLIETLGTQQATLAARGIDPGRGGTAQDLFDTTSRAAEDDIRANKFNLAGRVGGLAFQAQQSRLQGTAGLISGLTQAGTGLTSTYLQLAQTGSNPAGTLNRQPPVSYGSIR